MIEAIRPGGLGNTKGPRIQAILRTLGAHPDLDWLEDAPRAEALEFLTSPAGGGTQDGRMRAALFLRPSRDPRGHARLPRRWTPGPVSRARLLRGGARRDGARGRPRGRLRAAHQPDWPRPRGLPAAAAVPPVRFAPHVPLLARARGGSSTLRDRRHTDQRIHCAAEIGGSAPDAGSRRMERSPGGRTEGGHLEAPFIRPSRRRWLTTTRAARGHLARKRDRRGHARLARECSGRRQRQRQGHDPRRLSRRRPTPAIDAAKRRRVRRRQRADRPRRRPTTSRSGQAAGSEILDKRPDVVGLQEVDRGGTYPRPTRRPSGAGGPDEHSPFGVTSPRRPSGTTS